MTTPYEPVVLLKAEDKAPLFVLPAYPIGDIGMGEFIGISKVLLAFYIDDEGPGSIRELTAFSDDYARFAEQECAVLCVSCESIEKHKELYEKQSLAGIQLLADTTGDVGRAYGAIRGDRYIPDRVLFLIDRYGIIRHVHQGMPDNEALLAILEELM